MLLGSSVIRRPLVWYAQRASPKTMAIRTASKGASDADIPSATSVHAKAPERKTFPEEFRKFRASSSFKYWFLGGTVFASWICYYSYETYKRSRIEVLLPPPAPNHVLVPRNQELKSLYKEYQSKKALFGQPVTNLMIAGAPASGKTILANQFTELLLEKQLSHSFGLPKSKVVVFLQADSLDTFLTSLKTFAAKLNVLPQELNEKISNKDGGFSRALFEEQCHALFQVVQEKLRKHAGWIIVFDNLQSTTPPVINKILIQWFLDEQCANKWSRGTTLAVYDLPAEKVQQWSNAAVFTITKGMELADCQELIKAIVNLDEAAAKTAEFAHLSQKLFYNPLALVCASVLLREKLQSKELVSIKEAVEEICRRIDESVYLVNEYNEHLSDYLSSPAGQKLVVMEAVIAMALDMILNKNGYLTHGVDMMAACQPGLLLPQAALTRHLRNPFYRLPPLTQEKASILDMFKKADADPVPDKANEVSELDPKGKAWSNKNLAAYVRKVEDFFSELKSAVKLTYDLIYGILPDLPPKNDGLEIFRTCELLLSANIEPGGAKGLTLHPAVYNVARQHFTMSTVFQLEADHLKEHELLYNRQPWYKKLTGFSEQACLQKFRSGLTGTKPNGDGHNGHRTLLSEAEAHLFRYNFGVNVGDVFTGSPFAEKTEDFWLPSVEDEVLYLQGHLSRVIDSLAEEVRVSKQDLAGLSAQRNLMAHVEYILSNQPVDLIGSQAHVQGLNALATCYIGLQKDLEKGLQLLEYVHKLQTASARTEPLDLAHTLYRLAEVCNSKEEFDKARAFLEQAVAIHEAERKKVGEYKRVLEFGRALSLLGVVYGSLGEKQLSKETLERALMMQQSGAPDPADEAKSKHFGAEFASSLTDLGHAYVSLGMPLYGRKILELALAAHKNLHGDNHPEVVRTLTVLGVAHLMQGYNDESKRLRREAAVIQKKLNASPAL